LLSITLYLYLRDSKKFWISALFISLTLMTRGVMGFLFFSIIISMNWCLLSYFSSSDYNKTATKELIRDKEYSLAVRLITNYMEGVLLWFFVLNIIFWIFTTPVILFCQTTLAISKVIAYKYSIDWKNIGVWFEQNFYRFILAPLIMLIKNNTK